MQVAIGFGFDSHKLTGGGGGGGGEHNAYRFNLTTVHFALSCGNHQRVPTYEWFHFLILSMSQHDRVLRQLLDQHAPKKKRQVTVRPSAPWYTSDVVAEKRKRRGLERRWRASRLQCDRDQYVRQCCVVNNLIATLKSAHYTSIINEHSSDQRILFATVNKLLQKPSEKRYPPSVDNTALANSFADFFINKVDKIHSKLV